MHPVSVQLWGNKATLEEDAEKNLNHAGRKGTARAQVHKGQIDPLAECKCKHRFEDLAITGAPFPNPSCIQGTGCGQGQTFCHVGD